MPIKINKINKLIADTKEVLEYIYNSEKRYKQLVVDAHPKFQRSVRNLLHYKALRKRDLRDIQNQLEFMGLSRLARAEAHILPSLINAQVILNRLVGKEYKKDFNPKLTIKKVQKLQANNAKEIFGFRSKNRRVRIMVTMPAEAAHDYKLVKRMVASGMNCARINCAHDGPEEWEKMVYNLKKASKKCERDVKISMDIAGPKIRTGDIISSPGSRSFSPEFDEYGNVVSPALIRLVETSERTNGEDTVPIDKQGFKRLKNGIGMRYQYQDGRKVEMSVLEVSDAAALVFCNDRVLVSSEGMFKLGNRNTDKIEVGPLPPRKQAILLKTGDIIHIHRSKELGAPGVVDIKGNVIKNPHVSCSNEEVFDCIASGEQVFFDDGKIKGIITTVEEGGFNVKITHANKEGSKLRAFKGINLPNSDLNIPSLTEKDKEDLKFIAKYADVVNCSFVNSGEEVEVLYNELEALGVMNKLGVIFKIETMKAYNNLFEIIITAMRGKKVGVMIARGDLAIETGWEYIGLVQKEILSVCNAAHVPVVWATEVLASLAKSGAPSRSEITDTVNSLKADCVMLNKGPFIIETIQFLDRILSRMENFQFKNTPMLPKMEKLGK
ncbi:MAG: pyruvate kinase [Bacteroidetes bacterium]|nr:pyruvate kinase [Bacteroidota bacterium]MDA1122146.1 pyruvate kinase [Bacteroidota bacterium]